MSIAYTGQQRDAMTGHATAAASVRWWLIAIAALVFAMVVVGGATRLTDSGLSITEWKPLLGVIPPLSDADWHDAFTKYKQIPEYHLVNKGMSLAAFKSIFWWEWAHRFLGRFIGIAFIVPLIIFAMLGKIPRPMLPRLVGLFVLGGLQGAVGWFMVQSGLADRVDVSQYRLALHLTLALAIFGLLAWTILDLSPGETERRTAIPRWPAVMLVALVFLQVVLGAFVAGMKAGLVYNTWPSMNGDYVPDGLLAMSPWYLNLFENAATVQFDHRIVAYVLMVAVLAYCLALWPAMTSRRQRVTAGLFALGVLAQAVIGIMTLLAQVPISLGLLHQGGAAIVVLAGVAHLHAVIAAARPVRAPRAA